MGIRPNLSWVQGAIPSSVRRNHSYCRATWDALGAAATVNARRAGPRTSAAPKAAAA